MKKETYLNTLSQGLKQYDSAYIDEILSDYEEHFQDALARGKSEDEICAQLGDPAQIIREIEEMMDGPAAANLPGRPVIELEKAAGKASGQDERNDSRQNGRSHRTTHGGHRGQDSSHGQNTCRGRSDYSFHTDGSQGPKELKKVRFFAGSADVRIVPSPDGEFHMYTDDEDDMANIEHFYNEDTYEGRVTSPRNGSFFGLDFIYGFFGAAGGLVDDITLELPPDLEDVRIESTSGDVRAEGISCDILSLTTISGDCTIKNTEAQAIFISTKSGDIEMFHTITDHCDLKTLSGDIRGKELWNRVQTLNTVSGDVALRRLDARSTRIKTVSGEISVKLQRNDDTFYAAAKSLSGSIKILQGKRISEEMFEAMPLDEGMKLHLSTVSGSISARFSKNSAQR